MLKLFLVKHLFVHRHTFGKDCKSSLSLEQLRNRKESVFLQRISLPRLLFHPCNFHDHWTFSFYCIDASDKETFAMKSTARAIAIVTSIALLLAVLAACTPSNQTSSSSTTTLT